MSLGFPSFHYSSPLVATMQAVAAPLTNPKGNSLATETKPSPDGSMLLDGGDSLATEQKQRQFREVYDATYPDVWRYVVTRCASSADVADLVQNTYLNYYRRQLSAGHGQIDHPGRYLLRIARSELVRHYGLWGHLRNQLPVFSAGAEQDLAHLEPTFLFEEASLDRLFCEDIWAHLEQQDTMTFKIFALYFVNDLTIGQIAEELHLNTSAGIGAGG